MMDKPIDLRVLDQAARWLVEISDQDVPEAKFENLRLWRSAHPEHERAWLQAERFRSLMRGVPADVGMALLDRNQPDRSRRALLGAMALCLTALPSAWLATRLPWNEWTADYRTATGEQRNATLSDGTRIVLNTSSSVDVAFDKQQRLVRLNSGEIMVSTAADQVSPSRAFRVRTKEGMLRALGTRFSVRQRDGMSHVAVFEGAVEVRPAFDTGLAVVIAAGEQCTFSGSGVQSRSRVAANVGAWAQGVIVADHMRLADLVAELSRYRTGRLTCDAAVADMRISGTFQVRNTDQVLSLLVISRPLRVERRTRFWVTIKGTASSQS